MIIRYYEMSAVTGAGRPGTPATLNDLHKTAWSLYTGTGKVAVPRNAERPFTFRWDALPGRDGVYLFTIRSAFSFAGATSRSVDLSAGSELHLEFPLSPFRRIKTAEDKSRRIVPPREEWGAVAIDRFKAAGLAPGDISLTDLPKMSMRHRKERHPLLMVAGTATVNDPAQAADVWLRGGTPMRAYGLGQFTLLPDSPTQAVTA